MRYSDDPELKAQAASTARLTKVKQSMSELQDLIESTRSKIHYRSRKLEPPTQAKTRASQYSTAQHNYYSKELDEQQPVVSIDIEPKQSIDDSRISNYHVHIKDKEIKSRIDLNIEVKNNIDRKRQRFYTEGVDANPYGTGNSNIYTFSEIKDSYEVEDRNPYGPVIKQEKSERNFAEIIKQERVPSFSRNSSDIQIQDSHKIVNEENLSRKSKSPELYDYSAQTYHPHNINRNSNFTNSSKQKSIQKKFYESLIEEERPKPPSKHSYQIARNYQTNIVTPRNYINRKSHNQALNKSAKTLRVDLKDYSKNKQVKIGKREKEKDPFKKNKGIFINNLKKQEMERTLSKRSERSYSGAKRKSLSPQCQAVTNRLYQYRTKLPCSKCLKHHKSDTSTEMKKILKQYGFIRRYLSDSEINNIFMQMEHEGIPKQKWPVQIVNIVFKKLKYIYVS